VTIPVRVDRVALAVGIGRQIREARHAAGLTGTDLGVAIGMSPATAKSAISAIENGAAGVSLPRLVDLARVLGVSPRDLIP
jgi:transcriptional regulator with XRE-family HTH domain